MMKVKFREALDKDLPDLVNLLANDELGKLREDMSLPLDQNYKKAFTEIEYDANNQLIVSIINDQVVGMFQLTFIPYLTHKGSWRCLIEGVRVHEDYRGQGVGKLMFKHAIELAMKKGCLLIQLTSDKQRPYAIRFYEKLGFVASHEGFKLNLSNYS